MSLFKKYRLKDGNIYWNKLYFSIMPKFMTKYGPPFGDYNYAAYLYQPHQYIICLWYHMKWFFQRGYRGYADCDVWSIDWYLAGWLPKALRQLAKNKVGHPIGLTQKGWNTRLILMAKGFEAAGQIGNLGSVAVSSLRKFDKGMKLFHKHFFSLWD